MEIESYFFKEGHSSVNVDLKVLFFFDIFGKCIWFPLFLYVDSNELINHSFMIYTLCDVSPS
jgi:hypothetical protein